MRVKMYFRWFDLWVGAYIDTEGRRIFICPLPMLVLEISWRGDVRGAGE